MYFMGGLGSLANAVDQAAPQHYLRRSVQHGVNFLTAEEEKVSKILEREQAGAHRHKLPCKCIQTKQ
jgi:hypothetical protein